MEWKREILLNLKIKIKKKKEGSLTHCRHRVTHYCVKNQIAVDKEQHQQILGHPHCEGYHFFFNNLL